MNFNSYIITFFYQKAHSMKNAVKFTFLVNYKLNYEIELQLSYIREFDGIITNNSIFIDLMQYALICNMLQHYFHTLSGRTGSALVWHSEGHTFAADSVQ